MLHARCCSKDCRVIDISSSPLYATTEREMERLSLPKDTRLDRVQL